MDVGGPLKGVVVHQEGDSIRAANHNMTTALSRVANITEQSSQASLTLEKLIEHFKILI